MAEQLPETPFEKASKDERDKERLERQKILVALPRSKPEQAILSMLAEKTAEVHEEQEDVLVLLATEDLNSVKARLVQHLRSLCAKTARQFKVEQVTAKEGAAVAKQVFIPAPAYMGLDEEERKILEKCKKEQEASKKKETAKAESSWKMLNAKKTPYGYGYNYGKFGGGYGGASGFGGGAGGLGAWALQQLLAQKTGQGSEDKKSGGGGPSAAAGSSGQQDPGYAARMAANGLQYPCNGCGVLGHWKRDGECNPKDVAAYIKKKMEEQSKRDTEEDDDNESGTKYIFLDSSTKFDVNTEFLIF